MAEKRNGKSRKKVDEPYIPDQTEEEALDHIIVELHQDLENPKTPKSKRKASTSNILNIKEFEITEAKEDATKSTTKRQKTQPKVDVSGQEIVKIVKAPKMWTAAESAILKMLCYGCSPVGRNISGMAILFVISISFFFSFLFFFLIFLTYQH